MAYKIAMVPTEAVPLVWRKAAPFLGRVIPYTRGRASMPETLDRAVKNVTTLWVVYDEETMETVGSFTTRVDEYPGTKLLTGEMIGGDHFDEWIDDLQETLTIWAKANECNGIQLIGRRGWVRKLERLNYKEVFTTIEHIFQEEDNE